jgi:hypothetical protein
MEMEYLQNLNFSQIAELFCFVIGFIIFASSIFPIINSLRARDWTMAMGKIIHSEVYASKDTGDSTETYRPNIIFEYSVFGEKFTSDRLYYGVKIMSSGSLANSKKIVAKYPVNKEVAVYYNPEKPKQSVIEPWIHFGMGIIFGISICLVLLGVLIYHNSNFVQGLYEQFK